MPAAPRVERPTTLTFGYADPERDLAAVRLFQEVQRPRVSQPFAYADDGGRWTGSMPRPPADRIEYLFELEHPDGGRELVPDPANPRRAPGPFGDKSVLQLDGYAPPAWARGSAGPVGGTTMVLHLPLETVGGRVSVVLWRAEGLDVEDPAPVLVVHDGPEYGRYAGLLQYLDHVTSAGLVHPLRAVLLPPVFGRRDELYAADDRYARALAVEFVGLLDWIATGSAEFPRVGMGASLGALAMLHAHVRHDGVFGGLFLQSGSFFRPRIDRQERAFSRFGQITAFTDELVRGVRSRRVPTVMTCGLAEENLANNRLVANRLRRDGWPVELVEHRDAHNWVSWRDVLEPNLGKLLANLW